MSLAPGTRLGPYEVVGPVGKGGMGEVYRARDTRLDRDVAVKVLPEDVAGDPHACARFEKEAKAVAALSHPNVLALYDVGEAGGVHFAVTELLQGETLRAALQGEPLPVRRALEIAEQVARALAAAHESGIVHRDVKPENVFLTREGHVKVLDFGLARQGTAFRDAGDTHAPTVDAETEPGAVVGTVAYMSPEQARGHPVDYRSDQFSLGIVLYEMLSGARPFRGDSAVDTLSAITRDEPAPLGSLVPAVSEPVRALVDRCLCKEPSGRYESTRDLARELATWRDHPSGAGAAPAVAAVTVPAAPGPAGRSRWLVPAGAVVVLGVVAALAVWSWRIKKAARPPLEAKRLVVTVLENRTGEKSLDMLGRMASDWLTQGLSQIPEMEVVSTGETPQVDALSARGGESGALRALGEEHAAATVLSGAYYLQGDAVQFQVTTTDTRSGKVVTAFEPASGPRDAPMPAIQTLRERVMGALSVRSGGLSAHLAGSKAPLFDAYREYMTGLDLFAVDDLQAASHFEKASELDPDFLPPQLRLYSVYRRLRNRAKAMAILAHLEAQRERLTPWERNYVDAFRATDEGNVLKALKLWEENLKVTPNDPNTRGLVGLFSLRSNRPRQAIEALAVVWPEAYRKSPVFGALLRARGEAYHLVGRFDEEAQVGEEAVRYFPDSMLGRSLAARSAAAAGRMAEVDRVIQECLPVPARDGTPALVMVEAAAELHVHGHPADAERVASRAPEWMKSRESKDPQTEHDLVVRAEALYLAGMLDEAREVYTALAAKSPEDPDYPGRLGAVAARLGDRSEAQRFAEQLALLDRPAILGQSLFRRACIAARLGEKEAAVALLREAFAKGLAYGMQIHREVDLEPLRGYGPYDELMAPKG